MFYLNTGIYRTKLLHISIQTCTQLAVLKGRFVLPFSAGLKKLCKHKPGCQTPPALLVREFLAKKKEKKNSGYHFIMCTHTTLMLSLSISQYHQVFFLQPYTEIWNILMDTDKMKQNIKLSVFIHYVTNSVVHLCVMYMYLIFHFAQIDN